MQTDADDEAREADQRLRKLPQFDRDVTAPKSSLEHHVLAVVSPAFDERRRGEDDCLRTLDSTRRRC